MATVVCVGSGALGSLPATASGDTVVFGYNGTDGTDGSAQFWTVPAGVSSATFDLYGAEGGTGSGTGPPNSAGGRGAHLHAVLPLIPGQVLQVMVGGAGPGAGDARGGFNGGGGIDLIGGVSRNAGGGGGATDVRSSAALASRLLVAGGGGGGGGFGAGPGPGSTGGPAGGNGGDSGAIGTEGSDNTASTAGQPGDGGTIAGGGSGGAPGTGFSPATEGGDGALGMGGLPGDGSGFDGGDGGGGGGGFYGGGGGGGGGRQISPDLGSGGGGGGGGSSHADAAASAVVIEEGVRAGNGQVVISFTPPAPVVQKPRTRITGTPGRKKHKRRHRARLYTFKFADDLPGVTFLCQLDQRPFEPCTSPKTYRNLKPGKHTFTVKSVDAGGVESEPQTVSFRARPKRPK